MHQSTISKASSVQLNCATSAVIGSRPRGRRPRRKTLNGIANGKILKRSGIKKIVENKGCNSTSTVTKEESESSELECKITQQLPINPCNGTANSIDKNDHSNKNVSFNDNTIKKHSITLPVIDENKECNIGLTNNKKSNSRKRKQSDIGESVAKKRSLISVSSSDSLEKNVTTQSSLLNKPNMVVDIITFNFLRNGNSNETNQQYTGIRQLYSNCYGRTYWPTNWEYSAAALTSHVQKKMTKDTLRKIRLLCTLEANKANNTVSSLKTNLNLKKSVTQRRGSANKLAALASAEMSSSSRHNTSTSFTNAKRRKGRPPGRKNKHLMGVVKSNSPRKSPRKHASTLAAIMSTKVLNTDDKLETTQPKDIIDVDNPNTNSGDMDGPCILPIAAPKHECKQGDRRYRRRKRLDHQYNILERRRKRRRSSTPSPPKLCAQQPAPQRNSINNTVVIDQEVVKLRTKHVDVVRRRARDERLRSAFVCQQLHRVNEIAERGRQDLLLNDEGKQDYQLFDDSILLEDYQNQIWSSQMDCSIQEPDNMCLQIMYEQTGDKKFLSTELTDETLQIYYQQRDLALAERMTNNSYGDTMSSDLGTDMLLGGNKRKKKRPNMTGWPKEKRRKTITTANSSTVETQNDDQDIDLALIARRRKAAEQQRLRRQRIKMEQQLAKENSKVKQVVASIPKRPGRRPGPKKKKVVSKYRTTSVSSNVTSESNNTNNSTRIKRKNIKVQKVRKNRKSIKNKTEITISVPEATNEPQRVAKRRLGRPKGSIGQRKRIKLEMLKRSRNQTSLTDQQKENVVEPQTSTGKLKCVISTRNNRMKLLPSSSSSTLATSNKRRTATGTRIKKSSSAYNISTSCLTSSPLSETIVGKSTRITAKKRRLQQQMTSATTLDVGRPKRYTTNHGRSVSGVAVEEDCCFVGSQPFEQHCPGSGSGLSQNTVLENLENHQKDNTVHGGL